MENHQKPLYSDTFPTGAPAVTAGDGDYFFGGLADAFFGPVFGAELDEVGTAVAELLGEIGGGAVV